MTLAEIGNAMGVSRERVRQIERRALIKLKKRAPWLLDFLVEHARTIGEQCEEAADPAGVIGWKELAVHLRKRFRELGWR